MPNATSLIQRFISCTNAADASGLGALMTQDHRFVDATGATHCGREPMTAGWKQHFAMFPDYRIEIENTITEDDSAAGFGWASDSFEGERGKSWRIPCAFRLVERDGLAAEWRVYGDIEPMMQSAGLRRF